MKRKRKLSNKEIKKRLASVFDCREDQISFNVSEAVSGDVKYHQGSLCFDNGLDLSKILKTAVELRKMMDGMERNGSKLKLPEIVNGDFELRGFLSAETVILPEEISGRLKAGFLSAKGLVLPEFILGNIELSALESSEDLVFPEGFRGKVYLNENWSEEEKAAIQEKYPSLRIMFTHYVVY